ncbi:head-tail connector protein [Rubinisphaera italica]|uniref:Phage gp6-like head-tail connector protein n=1 Tax=Rubinisphaera italica TaxID=2527969 RepID=A0A5C5XPC7_9PLAN|nr:head-tail connector protein [Rubinisphaera italica]TWT64243.1 Phage gp6-like head-tail connector protein [Rubinisphaera italica]
MYILVAPETTAVDLTTVKRHCRIDHTDDDVYLTSLINVATETIEEEVQKTLVTTSYRLQIDAFPCGVFQVPFPPLITIDEISYQLSGEREVLSSSKYQVDESNVPGRLKILQQPSHDSVMGGIWIDFTAGHEPANVPAKLKHCLLMLVSHLYEMREPVTTLNIKDVPWSIQLLLNQEKWNLF